MAAQLFHIPFPTAFNSNGLAVPGAKCYFYVTGGTTAAPVYTTSALNVQHTQPVVANGAGRFASVYLDSTVTYRVVIQDDQGVELNDADPYTWTTGTLDEAVTFNNGDAGVASGTTYNGGVARTVSRNTFGLATTDSPMFTAINLGHASDTTLARSGAGDVTIEGNAVYRAGGTDVPVTDGGTGASTASAARDNLGVPISTAAQYRNDTAGKVLTGEIVWDAAEPVALTPGANVSLDLNSGINFTLAMGGNYTLDNPTNAKPGQCGFIKLTQDGTGSRTLAYGANYLWDGGTDGVLSTTAAAKDVLYYQVISSTEIHCTLRKAIA